MTAACELCGGGEENVEGTAHDGITGLPLTNR